MPFCSLCPSVVSHEIKIVLKEKNKGNIVLDGNGMLCYNVIKSEEII